LSYYELSKNSLSNINLNSDIDSDYDKILTALHNAGEACVSRCKVSFFEHCWDDDLNDLKAKSVEEHRLWVSCGRPRSGLFYQERRVTRVAYKRAIRNKRKDHDHSVSNDLHECLLSKDIDGFRKTWKGKLGTKSSLPECVDDVPDCSAIAQLFANGFADACKPNSQNQFALLKEEFTQSYYDYPHCSSDLECDSISVSCVGSNINKLQSGKAAGVDGIEAEHLKLAHPIVVTLLCTLFNKMLPCSGSRTLSQWCNHSGS